MRKPYVIKSNEIDTLLVGLASHGKQETFERMLDKALKSIDKDSEMDDKFLDMYETLLKRARMVEAQDPEDVQLQVALYTLASLLRSVAQKVYMAYLKKGEERDNPRFIRLVSYNKEAPVA